MCLVVNATKVLDEDDYFFFLLSCPSFWSLWFIILTMGNACVLCTHWGHPLYSCLYSALPLTNLLYSNLPFKVLLVISINTYISWPLHFLWDSHSINPGAISLVLSPLWLHPSFCKYSFLLCLHHSCPSSIVGDILDDCKQEDCWCFKTIEQWKLNTKVIVLTKSKD